MAQQTAVEWLVRKLSNELIDEIPLHRWDEIREAVQEAKEMEKEQIVNAVSVGYDYCEDGKVRWMGEQYYTETYKP